MRIFFGGLAVVWILLFGIGLFFHGHAPAQVSANIMTSQIQPEGVNYTFQSNKFECLLLFGALPITAVAFLIYACCLAPHQIKTGSGIIATIGLLIIGVCFGLFAYSIMQTLNEFQSFAMSPTRSAAKGMIDSSVMPSNRIKYAGIGICVATLFLGCALLGQRDKERQRSLSSSIAWIGLIMSGIAQIGATVLCYMTIHSLYSTMEDSSMTPDPSEMAEKLMQYFTTSVLSLFMFIAMTVILGILFITGKPIVADSAEVEDESNGASSL